MGLICMPCTRMCMGSEVYVAQSLVELAYYLLADADFYYFHTIFSLVMPHLLIL